MVKFRPPFGPPSRQNSRIFCRLRRALPVRPQRFFHLRAHTLGQPYIRSLRWSKGLLLVLHSLAPLPSFVIVHGAVAAIGAKNIIIPMIAHRCFGCGSDNLGVETVLQVRLEAASDCQPTSCHLILEVCVHDRACEGPKTTVLYYYLSLVATVETTFS